MDGLLIPPAKIYKKDKSLSPGRKQLGFFDKEVAVAPTDKPKTKPVFLG
jgi:hypothetical protein